MTSSARARIAEGMGKIERSRGIEIDDQPKFTGRLDRQIRGTRALEDLVDITFRAAEQVAVIGGE